MAAVSSSDVDQLNQGFVDMTLNSNQDNNWDLFLGNKKGEGGGWRSWAKTDTKKTEESTNNILGELNNQNSEDELLSDDYDSDDSQTSHDSRKKNPWFSEFFGILDDLTAQQINEPARQWHCPACQHGPCSIKWYRGIKSFLTHVKTKGTRRPKLHRDFAELLDEEICRRGAVVIQTNESYGKWKGLDNKSVQETEIIWPPMVIIMNTQLEKDENEKWLGMGPQELLEYFASYEAVRARSSFGPEGHRGMSVLIFDTSAFGYLGAERLSKDFEREGVGRDAWDNYPNVHHVDGKRQLYGFMATKQDLDVFNEHSHAKLKMKFELVSYQEKIVKQLKQMNEDSQQLHWYKKKIAKQERSLKAVEEAFWLLSQKLRKLEEEKLIVRQRTQLYHEQNKEEMDFQEKFFKEQLKVIQNARDANKKEIETLQEETKKLGKSFTDARKEKDESLTKEMKEIEEERDRLMKLHEEEMIEMKGKHEKEEIELEERFNAKFDRLMEKCAKLVG